VVVDISGFGTAVAVGELDVVVLVLDEEVVVGVPKGPLLQVLAITTQVFDIQLLQTCASR